MPSTLTTGLSRYSRPAPALPLLTWGTPRAVKFLVIPVPPTLPDSKARRICQRLEALENLSVRRELGRSLASDSGSCRATETADGEREIWTSSSFAPDGNPDRRKGWLISICLLSFLLLVSFHIGSLQSGRTSSHTGLAVSEISHRPRRAPPSSM